MTTADEKMREEYEKWLRDNFLVEFPRDQYHPNQISYPWEAWQASAAQYSERIKELEQQIGLYQADNERIWSFMPELKDTPEQYEIHEAVQHVVQQNEQLQAQVVNANAALRYAIDDLTIRAKLLDDDSLNIGQGCLDQMHEAINFTTQTAEAYKRRAQAEALEKAANEIDSYDLPMDKVNKAYANMLRRMAAELKEGEQG